LSYFQSGLGVLGKALGIDLVPNSLWQAMAWFHNFIPRWEKFHMVILASVVWVIWNIRNRVTFDLYILKSPSVISFFSISLLLYWAGILKDLPDKDRLIEGAQKMKLVAAEVYSHQVAADSLQLVVSSVV
jgi:hypothetical protein